MDSSLRRCEQVRGEGVQESEFRIQNSEVQNPELRTPNPPATSIGRSNGVRRPGSKFGVQIGGGVSACRGVDAGPDSEFGVRWPILNSELLNSVAKE
jgi:hypothetical protein